MCSYTLRIIHIYYVGFEVFTAVNMKNAVFWDVVPCEFIINRRFGETRRHIPEDGILHVYYAQCSSPHSAEVQNGGIMPPLPHKSSCLRAELVKHRGNYLYFTFTSLYNKTGTSVLHNNVYRITNGVYWCFILKPV
jgi:hypothetical protein